jgi:hypothetical protein
MRVPRRLRELARRKTDAEADAESAAGLDEYSWNPRHERVLTEEEVARLQADFIKAVESRAPVVLNDTTEEGPSDT